MKCVDVCYVAVRCIRREKRKWGVSGNQRRRPTVRPSAKRNMRQATGRAIPRNRQVEEVSVDLASNYHAHAGQRLFHSSQAKYKVLACGRRWGKGRACVQEMIKLYFEFLSRPFEKTLVPQVHMWALAPDYPQAMQMWMELKHFIPERLIVKCKEVEKHLWLLGDCLIELKSAYNPESLQSVGLDAIWIAEAADIPDSVWYEQVMPMLMSPGRAGKAIVEGKPKGVGNWFHNLFLAGQDKTQSRVESWQFSSYDNPLVEKEELDEFRAIMPPHAFDQEIMAQFIGDTDRAFENIRECATIAESPFQVGHRYIMAVDLGKAVDSTVVLVSDRANNHIVKIWVGRGVNWVLQKEKIKALSDEYGRATVVIDSSGPGDSVVDDLKVMGVVVRPVQFTKGNREDYMDKLAVCMAQKIFRYPPQPLLIRQLERMERKKLPLTGKFRTQVRPGEHDDFVSAMALLASTVNILSRGNTKTAPPTRYLSMGEPTPRERFFQRRLAKI